MSSESSNFSRILKLPRKIKVIFMILIDASLCLLSIWISYYLRLGSFSTSLEIMFLPIILSLTISLLTFWFLRIYKNIFRNFDMYNITKLTEAVLIYSIIFFLIVTGFSIENVPRTIGFIQPIVFLFLIFSVRIFFSFLLNYKKKNFNKKNIALIYGSGNAGLQLLNSLQNSDLFVEGFVDDNKQVHGGSLNGKTIYSPNNIKHLINSKNVNQILLAIPSLKRNDRNRIFKELSKLSIIVKSLPTLSNLAEGFVHMSDIQEPSMEDFLGREQVEPKIDLMRKNIFNKVIFITGAGGSIGSELCRQIIKLDPKKLILFENNEFALHKIRSDLDEFKSKNYKLNDIELISFLGSVQDNELIEYIISSCKPETIFHAAAYKHVSIVEKNILEGIKNNVFGTINVFRSAIENKVSNFVLISTDKAVMPTNVMGATKRLSEMYVQSLKRNNSAFDINLSIVRFGNVLDSSGSVIPIFKKQIQYGGPITLSHLEVTRYFMTIPEASLLVIQASSMNNDNGEIFVLDMGKPIKILDLALKMIRLSGYSLKDQFNPEGNIEIIIKGLTPGEKLHEDLLIGNNPLPTEHPKILKIKDKFIHADIMEKEIEKLKTLIYQNETNKIHDFFNELSSEFNLKKIN